MKFKNFLPLTRLVTLVAVATASLALLPAIAAAARPLIDSTGVAKTVISTQVIPVGLSQSDVTSIVNNTNSTNSVTSSAVPAGYTEVRVPMGPRYLGSADSGLAGAGYYYALTYPTVLVDGGTTGEGLGAGGLGMACAGSVNPRVVAIRYHEDPLGSFPAAPTEYYVCGEPQGSRSTLQKSMGAQQLALNFNDINVYKIGSSIGVSTNAATAVCQKKGYTNFVQGAGTVDGGFGCGDQITRWDGTRLYADSACYNSRLLSVTCWK